MTSSPDDLLGDAAVDAAVIALAERNAHHFESMSDTERAEAIATWRDLAIAVLSAARAAAGGSPAQGGEDEGGRAVVVVEDVAPGEIGVHVSLFPPPQDVDGGEALVTPAQAAALEWLEQLIPDEDLPA